VRARHDPRGGAALALLALFLPSAPARLSAQRAAHEAAASARFEKLEAETGPSHNSIYAITQDRTGFLWLGTQDGLNRWDGYAFRVWRNEPADPDSLAANRIDSLFEDSRGRLWIGTAGGLDRFDRRAERPGGRFVHYPLGDREGQQPWIWRILETRDETVWLATSIGLFRFEEGTETWSYVVLSRPEPGHPVWYLAEDPHGDLWALEPTTRWEGPTMRSLHILSVEDPSVDAPYPLLWKLDASGEHRSYSLEGHWGDFAFDESGRLWMSASGPASIDEARRTVSTRGANAAPRPARDGGLWFPDPAGDVYRLRPGADRTEWVGHVGRAMLDSAIRDLHQDRSGIVWVGTLAGLYRWDPMAKPFGHIGADPDDPRGLREAAIASLYEDSAGDLWIGTFGGGLHRREHGATGFDRYPIAPEDPGGLPGGEAWVILEHAGRLWVGSNQHVCSVREGAFDCTPAPDSANVQAMVAGPQGGLWIRTGIGLARLDPVDGSLEQVPMPGVDAGGGTALQLIPDQRGGLWIAPWSGPLRRFDFATRRFASIPRVHGDGWEATGVIFDLYLDGDGILWMGTVDGLSRFDPATGLFRTFSEGLLGSNVFSVLEDDDRQLWLGTNRGLARFDRKSETFRVFGRRDGVVNVEFDRKARLRASDGTFYFGGLNGITVFRPEEIVDYPYVPPVALTAIEVLSRDGTHEIPTVGLERLELEYWEDTLEFEFAALSFAQPEGNRYRYWLEGLDEDWVEAGDRRFARYVRVPAGNYTLHVQAANHDGVWNRAGITLPIVVSPPVWETLWFRLLVGAAVAAAIYGLYRYRLARLLAVERLRTRIAGDLHDQLSSDLSGIALASDMVSRRRELDEEDRSRLHVARDTALASVEALRDIVWYVNPQQDSLEALGARMRSTAQRLLPDHELDIRTSVSDSALPMELRRQLFLTYKELLHNVSRHARARRVEVRFEQRERMVELMVADDGVGFDPSREDPTVADSAPSTGTGLTSVRTRAAHLRGTVEIASRPGQGTRITLRAPLPRTRGGDGVRSELR
jgi:signal transduction histidine kinase/ligand-binding sensor domain-containing protein